MDLYVPDTLFDLSCIVVWSVCEVGAVGEVAGMVGDPYDSLHCDDRPDAAPAVLVAYYIRCFECAAVETSWAS